MLLTRLATNRENVVATESNPIALATPAVTTYGELANKACELWNTLLMSLAEDNNLIKKQNQLS